jgi:hypothetical protein
MIIQHLISAGSMIIHGVNNDIGNTRRVLFYDTRLSINNAVACGSCHKQSIAFSDDVTFSPGLKIILLYATHLHSRISPIHK